MPQSMENHRAALKFPGYYWEFLDEIPHLLLVACPSFGKCSPEELGLVQQAPCSVPGPGQKLPSRGIKSRDNLPYCQEGLNV